MTSLIEQLTEASKDLLYMSESDYPLEPFVWTREEQITEETRHEENSSTEEATAKEVEEKIDEEVITANTVTTPSLSTIIVPTADDILKNTKHEAETKIEEITLDKFFYRPTKIEDWFGDEEIETAQKFSALQKLIESSLQNIKVFRVGEIQIDVYIVGVDAEGNFAGLKTTAIET